ncbi:MAG: hypothetical protein SNJ54_15620 [Anaerolineae bacterium]
MPEYRAFTIRFDDQQSARAVLANSRSDLHKVLTALDIASPRPVLFISGGAALMEPDDLRATRAIIEDAIVAFAQQHNLIVIDGGTQAGVMQLMGEARQRQQATFPLIGVAPRPMIHYPNSRHKGGEIALQPGHSHFVLMERGSWGHESQMIVGLTRAISGGVKPMLGVLINGGKIAEQDIYIATTRAENPVPVLVLDGSGRKADEVSTAFKTGETNSRIIRAIVAGGAIDLVSLRAGPAAMLAKLAQHFGASSL